MADLKVTEFDERVRGELTRAIADLGYSPNNTVLARDLGVDLAEVELSLQRLHDTHSLLLHPHACKPWLVHPFALSPGLAWVQAGRKGYWANCLYCGMGIAAATKKDAKIHLRLGGESETVIVEINDGTVQQTDFLFHLSTPLRFWWDNVIHACARFQLFRTKQDILSWCERHDLPFGASVPLPQMWQFAKDWYGNYLSAPWKKRTEADAVAVLARNGLTGDFWRTR
jgi:hypothetical protein